jgi:putative transposase
MSHWQLVYHAVWSTKERKPLITPDMEQIIYGFMRAKACELGGVVFAINGVADHVHMVVAIPPSISVADFIGQVKGVTSAKYNSRLGEGMSRLQWQGEYGVFSFDAKRLPGIVAYVENQKEHHAKSTLIQPLERWEDGGVRTVSKEAAPQLAKGRSSL